MTQPPIIYDLVLLLSTSLEDDRRARILSDVEEAIVSAGGRVEVSQEWGVRSLAFEIDHIRDADYHLRQFSGPPTLIETLSYNLKITDGVVRHRIIKVTPGTPPPPDPGTPTFSAEPAEASA